MQRLTASQSDIWASQNLHAGIPLLNESMACTICASLQPEVMQSAWANVVRDYPVLRTIITDQDGTPFQSIADHAVPLKIIDFSTGPDAVNTSRQWMLEQIRQPFRSEESLVFCALLKLSSQRWIWLCKTTPRYCRCLVNASGLAEACPALCADNAQ